jgi:GT2 family glycosyltransferase
MNNPKIGIVLVNYNGKKYQADCINTISHSTYKNYMIIVVDSGSSDGSVEELRNSFNEIRILEMHQNVGVAKGNNIGIKYALENGCDYVLLLNNDTEVDQYMLERLVNNASSKVITVPKIYYYNNKKMLWFAGGEIDWHRGFTIHYGDKEMDNGKYNEKTFINYAPTCCMLVHKSIFNSIGLMDESYFMYYDDTDFCARVNNGGYQIKFIPSSIMWHKVSSSSGGEDSPTILYYATRNRIYFINKFKSKTVTAKVYFYLTRLFKIIWWFCNRKYTKIRILLNAIKDYKKNNMGISSN